MTETLEQLYRLRAEAKQQVQAAKRRLVQFEAELVVLEMKILDHQNYIPPGPSRSDWTSAQAGKTGPVKKSQARKQKPAIPDFDLLD